MKRWLQLIAMSFLMTPAAWAAGTLVPVGSGATPVQIRDHQVNVTLNNGFAQTEVNQVFFNPGDAVTEAIYSFPLPKSASLAEITIWSGERVMNGEVIEADEATRIYEEERASGNDAGLGECSCVKDKEDIEYRTFKFSIANVAPAAETRIRFVYYQPLEIDTGIGRYVYPLEGGGTDERAKSFWLNNPRVENNLSIEVELKSAWPVDEVRVPGLENEVTTEQLGVGHYKVSLARPGGELSRDFVFYYRLADDLPGRVELIPYKAAGSDSGTFMMVVTPGLDLQPITGGADYVFVLDVSGSMSGKIHTLARAVEQTLGEMGPGDRFRIVAFNNRAHEVMGFSAATPDNVARAIEEVSRLSTGRSTNLYAGLDMAMSRLDADRATSVILVTDAVTNTGIVDPKEFHALMKKYDVRVFGFVMGNSANWPLMETIAAASGGFSAGVSNDDDIIGQILLAKSKITHEALHDAEISIRGVAVSDATDGAIGKIYRGQQLVLFGRYQKGGKAKVRLQASLTGKDKTYETTFEFPDVAEGNPEVERLWALSRIDDLERQRMVGLLPGEEAESAITRLGVEYQLVTDYTSMVVLTDEDHVRHGIERRNRDRVDRERSAQSIRATTGPKNNRVDQSQPMFDKPAPRVGAGAFDPVSVGLVTLLAGAALVGATPRSRRGRKQGERR